MNKFWKNLNSVRWRLTQWFSFVLALCLVIFSLTVYLVLYHSLNFQLASNVEDGVVGLAANLKHEFGEGVTIQVAADNVISESGFRNLLIEIYSPDGILVKNSDNSTEPVLLDNLDLKEIPTLGNGFSQSQVTNSKYDKSGFEIAAVRVLHEQSGQLYIIVVGGRKSIVAHELITLRNIIFALFPFLLLISGIGGYYLSKRALKPVAEMTKQARTMNAADLSERLQIANPNDELGLLAVTFNELFDRIEKSFEQMRQFIADASHELRTPVAVIRTETDVALTEPREENEAFSSLEVIRDEAKIMSRLVEDMFTLARADIEERENLRLESLQLAGLIDTCVRSAETLGRSRGVQVIFESNLPSNVICQGDRTRIAQVLLNLLDNATKYTQSGGLVTISARIKTIQENSQAIISIADNGPGIPPEFRELVFTRFYRVDKARSRDQGGSGLGLSIARQFTELHGGSLTLHENEKSGCLFTLRLPLKNQS